MDQTDLILSLLLLANSRTPYSGLAETLGLSVNAVHKRIQSMVADGIIRAFTAKVSLSALGVFPVLIYGRSEADSTYAIEDALGAHELVYWVAQAGGNYVYVGAYLRDIQELPGYVEFVKDAGKIPDPTVGLIQAEYSGKGKPLDELLQPLDWEIIHALSRDSRKAVSKVAEEVGYSSKTVRRRLSRLIDEGLIELSTEWFPSASNDIMTTINVEAGPASTEEVLERLTNGYRPNHLFSWGFSNMPELLVSLFWSPSMNDLRELVERLGQEAGFSSTTPIILYSGNIYETWRDDLVKKKAGAPRPV
jgi:DNA-binding Lrp family transcriptional regulator